MGQVAQIGYLTNVHNLLPGMEFPLHVLDCHL